MPRGLQVQQAASHLDPVGSGDPREVDPQAEGLLDPRQQRLGPRAQGMADLALLRAFRPGDPQGFGQADQLREDEERGEARALLEPQVAIADPPEGRRREHPLQEGPKSHRIPIPESPKHGRGAPVDDRGPEVAVVAVGRVEPLARMERLHQVGGQAVPVTRLQTARGIRSGQREVGNRTVAPEPLRSVEHVPVGQPLDAVPVDGPQQQAVQQERRIIAAEPPQQGKDRGHLVDGCPVRNRPVAAAGKHRTGGSSAPRPVRSDDNFPGPSTRLRTGAPRHRNSTGRRTVERDVR